MLLYLQLEIGKGGETKIKDQILKIKYFLALLLVLGCFLVLPTRASAHVTVKPSEVNVASFNTFTVGVPVEKEIATIQVRLVIPDGLNHVTPNVKSGWNVDVKKTDDEKVTEIIWYGGVIPEGRRDEFMFSAQVPSAETTLAWKAYQTYEDGTEVSWDHDPKQHKMNDEETTAGPYSETSVKNDLQEGSESSNVKKASPEGFFDRYSSSLSVIAILISIYSLRSQKKSK